MKVRLASFVKYFENNVLGQSSASMCLVYISHSIVCIWKLYICPQWLSPHWHYLVGIFPLRRLHLHTLFKLTCVIPLSSNCGLLLCHISYPCSVYRCLLILIQLFVISFVFSCLLIGVVFHNICDDVSLWRRLWLIWFSIGAVCFLYFSLALFRF